MRGAFPPYAAMPPCGPNAINLSLTDIDLTPHDGGSGHD